MTVWQRLLGESGQDLLEYALLAALIAVTAIAGVKTLGDTIHSTFWEVIANYH